MLLLALLFPLVSAAEPLRLNHLQIIGTHNSYHLSMGAEYFEKLLPLAPQAKGWDYEHAPLDTQLERGVRSFELDLHWTGDAFRVLHVPHYDTRSSCEHFEDCLGLVKAWSDAHPKHVPIIILVELKGELHELDATLRDFTADSLDQMDAVVRDVFPEERLITPDRVRGDAATLEAAITTSGWPLLDDVRGTVMLVLHETGQLRDWYVEGRPSAEGRAMFPQSVPGAPYSAFIIQNNPFSERIQPWLEQGYMIRTRADSDTAGTDRDLAPKRDQAFRSGAHVIHTDYPPGEAHAATGYIVQFENAAPARCNPITHPGPCEKLEP